MDCSNSNSRTFQGLTSNSNNKNGSGGSEQVKCPRLFQRIDKAMTATKEIQAELQEIFGLMGMGLALLHKIESLFAKAVVFGLNDRDLKSGKTLREILENREEMTFGQMVADWKEEWDLNPLLNWFLNFFVTQRNIFVHKLTEVDGFKPRRKRDRKRLTEWLKGFIQIELGAKEMFQDAMFASMHLISSQTDIPHHRSPQLPEEVMQGVRDLLDLCRPKRGAHENKTQLPETTPKPVLITEELTSNLDKFFKGSNKWSGDGMLNYICRWTNGDILLVFGHSQQDVLDALDEIDDPSKCELVPVRAEHYTSS